MGCVFVFRGVASKLIIVTLDPFFARVPITRIIKAMQSTVLKTLTTVTTSRSGVAPSSRCPRAKLISEDPTPHPLPPRAAAAAAFPHSYSLEESHRLQIQPTSQNVFAKSLTKISLSRPRPLLPCRVPHPGPQRALLSSRVLHVGTRAGAVFPLAPCKDLGNLKPDVVYSPVCSCLFTKLAPWEKIKQN